MPGEGHLGAAQFVGVVTHADTSPTDNTDNINQPSTTWFITSDDPTTSNDQYNEVKSTNEYTNYMTVGHPEQSQAESWYRKCEPVQ